MTIKIDKLGLRIDGWADLIEGAGEKADVALQAVAATMEKRGMPKVSIKPANAAPNATSSKSRPYVFVEMPNGACVTVYLGQYGSDLYASWDLYVRPILNLRTILIILGVALLLVAPGGLIGLISSISLPSSLSDFMDTAGIVMGLLVGSSCLSCFGYIINTIFVAFLVAIAGYITKQNWLAYFFKELTVFDSDDIGAMSLAVHKTVLLALDSVGISTKTLRLKEVFKAGGQGRLI